MHFHLAAVFMLIPLLAAAPTPIIGQGVDITDTVKGAAKQLANPLTGGLSNLPTGNGKRQAPAEIIGKVTEAVGSLAGGVAGVKREPADIVKAVTGALYDLSNLPTGNGKRQAPAEIIGKVTEAVGSLAGGVAGVKREPADIVKAVTDALYDLSNLPTGNGKRQAPAEIIGKVTEAVVSLAGGVAGVKREEPADIAKAVTGTLEEITGGALPKLPIAGKREPINTLKTLATALKITKPITDKLASGKRDDGMDVTKELDELLVPVTDAINKYYNKVYKLPEGQESQSEKRDGVDVASAAKSVINGVIAGVTEAANNA